MVTPLISTKYNIPPTGINLVERHVLLQKLNQGFCHGRRLILICAPAGYGKTSLVSAWANQVASHSLENISGRKAVFNVAWLTCDKDDNDLSRFLSYLIAALQKVNAHVGEGLLSTFHASKPQTPEVLATILVNELMEIPNPFILVLDDFHSITSHSIHEFLTFIIEHQPSKMSLVLVTRADPAFPLARFRARGQLDEIRQNELFFTLEEANLFFSQTMGVELSKEQVSALERRTEGWIVGLQLAALYVRTTKDVSAFIETFSGGHEYIADYLTDEVLAQESNSIQSFLLQTSILEGLTASLCTAVTGNIHAQDILEYLKEKNLFLLPLDHQKEWYRYHALFSDLLRNRLHRLHADQMDDLYLRASRWYKENGMLILAIKCALAGHAIDHAATLLEQSIESVFISGQVNTLLSWLELMTDKTKNRHSILWIFHGLVLIWCGKSSAAVKPLLKELTSIFKKDGLMGESHTLQALYAMTEGRPSEAGLLAQNAMQELSPERTLFNCLAADTLGMAKILQSETHDAIRVFEKLSEVSSQAGYGMFEIMSLSHLAGLNLQQGHLNAAEHGYHRALDLAVQKMGKCSPVTGNVLLGLGELARERNDLEGALRFFFESVEMFSQFSEMGVPIAYLSIARVNASEGDWKSAQEYLEKARQYTQASKVTRLNDQLVTGLQARFWIDCGELGLAEQWAREKGLMEHSFLEIIATAGQNVAGSEFMYNDYLTLARLYLAKNNADAALKVIDPILSLADTMGYLRRVIQILVLKALALQEKKEVELAVDMIGRALDLAERDGYQRVFLDEGESLLHLLYKFVERGHSHNYAKKIIASFKQSNLSTAVKSQLETQKESLFEPLSNREHEVLLSIAEGLSNREISKRLYISLSTVKGHLTNIYNKLGVNSRTQAILEATRLGILDH